MGCGPSKIDQEETVARCKDRKRFIREAVAARNGLAAAHSAYAAALKNTGAALSDYVQGESIASSDIQRVHQNTLAITSSARRAVADTPADSIYPPPPPDAPQDGSGTLAAPLRLMPSGAALVEMARNNKGKAPMYASVTTQEENFGDYGNAGELVVSSTLPPPPPPPPPPPRKKGKVVSLLQVLNELDKDFLKASASAHNVLKSLEAVRMHYHSNFANNRGYIDHSARVLEAIIWNRSPKDDDTENGETKEKFDKDHEWDTHATILDKIAALEKKLYNEVKEVEIMKMAYTDKLESLNKKKRRGAGSKSIERTRSFASHLHTKYVVAMQTMESTLSEIDRLRDSQLYPKLVELVDGLGRMWEAMCEHHSKQRKTISILKHCEVAGMTKQTTEQHHDRTVQLFQIVQDWHVQFHRLASYQKEYVHSLTNWLILSLMPIDTDVRKKPGYHQEPDHTDQVLEPEVSDEQQEPLPIEMLLRGWSACLDQLQHEVAGSSIASFAEAIHSIITLQDEELKLKQSCEAWRKELDKRERQFDDWSRKYPEKIYLRPQSQPNNLLEKRQASLEALRKGLEDEETNHREQCRVVREKSLGCFLENLPDAFRAMLEFSLGSSIMYKRLFATTQPVDEEDDQ